MFEQRRARKFTNSRARVLFYPESAKHEPWILAAGATEQFTWTGMRGL